MMIKSFPYSNDGSLLIVQPENTVDINQEYKNEQKIHARFIMNIRRQRKLEITLASSFRGNELFTVLKRNNERNQITLRELIFAGTNFCGFCGFGPKPQNQVPAKIFKCEKHRSNNSQNGSNFLSSEKSAKLIVWQKCELKQENLEKNTA